MISLPKRIRVMPALVFCLALWVILFSLVLLVSGHAAYLPGFLVGAAGSALYMYLLYRRIPAMLTRSLVLTRPRPNTGNTERVRSGGLKYLRSGWMKTMQPIAAMTLVILALSHFFQSISFLAALFGFFSFQISLFLYAVLILIFDFIQVSD